MLSVSPVSAAKRASLPQEAPLGPRGCATALNQAVAKHNTVIAKIMQEREDRVANAKALLKKATRAGEKIKKAARATYDATYRKINNDYERALADENRAYDKALEIIRKRCPEFTEQALKDESTTPSSNQPADERAANESAALEPLNLEGMSCSEKIAALETRLAELRLRKDELDNKMRSDLEQLIVKYKDLKDAARAAKDFEEVGRLYEEESAQSSLILFGPNEHTAVEEALYKTLDELAEAKRSCQESGEQQSGTGARTTTESSATGSTQSTEQSATECKTTNSATAVKTYDSVLVDAFNQFNKKMNAALGVLAAQQTAALANLKTALESAEGREEQTGAINAALTALTTAKKEFDATKRPFAADFLSTRNETFRAATEAAK